MIVFLVSVLFFSKKNQLTVYFEFCDIQIIYTSPVCCRSGQEVHLLGVSFYSSNLHERESKQRHKAREKMEKKMKGETFSVPPGGMSRLNPNAGPG